MKARITVTLKVSVLDPQGKAIADALHGLGFSTLQSVRQGKLFDIELKNMPKAEAEAECAKMCEQLLANGVIENYQVEILGA
ncbi:phosphoribosylformylglycinamidine synthase subunit PurS [Bartonella sp. DGB2]|uniref:phosphoribosylformylglycinamidine synthase subunit PurS n=1 Tax=Bartonella sp. DGB2 TaxID=3388426 RepID=UPI00398FD28A